MRRFNTIVDLLAGVLFVINYINGKAEVLGLITGILFLLAGIMNLISCIKGKKQSKTER